MNNFFIDSANILPGSQNFRTMGNIEPQKTASHIKVISNGNIFNSHINNFILEGELMISDPVICILKEDNILSDHEN